MSDTRIVYSVDEENFIFDDINEALDRLDCDGYLEEGATLYEGDAIQRTPSEYFRLDSMLEDMGERASDEAGEWADTFPDLSHAKRAELQTLIANWIDANVDVNFWSIKGKVREITVTAEMISEFRGDTAGKEVA